MSMRYEGARLPYLTTSVVGPGEQLGEDIVTSAAVVLSYDEVFYIEGEPEALLSWAQRLVKSIEDHIDAKAFDRDKAQDALTSIRSHIDPMSGRIDNWTQEG